jgi:hypothetical protein
MEQQMKDVIRDRRLNKISKIENDEEQNNSIQGHTDITRQPNNNES